MMSMRAGPLTNDELGRWDVWTAKQVYQGDRIARLHRNLSTCTVAYLDCSGYDAPAEGWRTALPALSREIKEDGFGDIGGFTGVRICDCETQEFLGKVSQSNTSDGMCFR